MSTRKRATLLTAILAGVMSLGPGVALAQPAAPTPSSEQLTASLKTIFDTEASPSDRAKYVEGGSKAIPSADSVGNALRGAPVTLRVQDPIVNGDQLDTQLAVALAGMGVRSYPLVWIYRDEQWKLSNQSFCAIANQISNSCSV